jgi:hypothetical protein
MSESASSPSSLRADTLNNRRSTTVREAFARKDHDENADERRLHEMKQFVGGTF